MFNKCKSHNNNCYHTEFPAEPWSGLFTPATYHELLLFQIAVKMFYHTLQESVINYSYNQRDTYEL